MELDGGTRANYTLTSFLEEPVNGVGGNHTPYKDKVISNPSFTFTFGFSFGFSFSDGVTTPTMCASTLQRTRWIWAEADVEILGVEVKLQVMGIWSPIARHPPWHMRVRD
jgi:hypothetical protein